MERKISACWLGLAMAIVLIAAASFAATEEVVPGLTVVRGAVNGACIERNGRRLIVYGDPSGKWSAAGARARSAWRQYQGDPSGSP
ncbi:hypothetical protein FJY63_04930, partial [Candidatus Sumerlaeota bacterium]|nr:hypothetical protein [Candidatus Sumerlaeota bacterium]